jgi:hypothetical protein
MKTILPFIRFLLAASGNPRLNAWHVLRRACFQRMGMETKRVRK